MNPDNLKRRWGAVPGVVRFWTKVDRSGGPDACWPWMPALGTTRQYGSFNLGGRNVNVHRIAAAQAGIVTTEDKPFILHSCDNPSCCNPAHLRAGSPQDNMDDAMARERKARGTNHGAAVLTDEIVRHIRIRHSDGQAQRAIARDLGVSRGTVKAVIRGKTWRHVT